MQVRLPGPVDVVADAGPRPVHGLRRMTVLATPALRCGEVVQSPPENAGLAGDDRLPGCGRRRRCGRPGDGRGEDGDRLRAAARPSARCQHRLVPLSVSRGGEVPPGSPRSPHGLWRPVLGRR